MTAISSSSCSQTWLNTRSRPASVDNPPPGRSDPGPAEGVVNGLDDAYKAVRARYKEGMDLIKITDIIAVPGIRLY